MIQKIAHLNPLLKANHFIKAFLLENKIFKGLTIIF